MISNINKRRYNKIYGGRSSKRVLLAIVIIFLSLHTSVYGKNVWEEANDKSINTPDLSLVNEKLEYNTEQSGRVKRYNIYVKDVRFANVRKYGAIINNYGSMLYTNTLYLKPKIYFDYENSNQYDTKVILSYKIIKPDGTISVTTDSNEYTSSTEIVLRPRGSVNREFELKGWGNKSGTIYKIPGEYKFEIWVSGEKIYSTSFTIRKAGEPNILINKVEFANTNKNGRTIDNYGSTLYTTMSYLRPKIYFDYENSSSNNTTIGLSYNVIKPNGDIIQTAGMGGYSFTENINLIAGGLENQSRELLGLGNLDNTLYSDPGEYKFEIWVSEQKIYSTSFSVKAKK